MNTDTAINQGSTQQTLLHLLSRDKGGLAVDTLATRLNISRNAVRQHLTSLERDGVVAKGPIQASGGRPEQLYVLTERGAEAFPRQYAWFAELLLRLLESEMGSTAVGEKMAELGRTVAESLKGRLAAPDLDGRIAGLVEVLQEMGYDAAAVATGAEPIVEAHNCVFHKLAKQYPHLCTFDIAFAETATGRRVEHRTCMARGDSSCRFHFRGPVKAGARRVRGKTEL
jgi:predicted ArsR family transcriptional regulator